MKLSALEVRPYRLAIAQAPHNAERSWPVREGLLIRLVDEQRHVGQGEAAPLPGFSPDDLGACERELRRLDVTSLPEFSPSAPLTALAALGARFAHVPALRCGLEGALLDLMAQDRGEPAWATLRRLLPAESRPGASVPVAALLQAGDAVGRFAEAARAVARGIRTLKVKVGRPGEFERERAELEVLRAHFGAEVSLRVDANRAWSAQQAEPYLDALESLSPEYVEEPTAEWHELARSAVPLALDESLVVSGLLERVLRRREALKLSVCVLKPTLIGGVVAALEILRIAEQSGVECVISHTFEGPLGFALASALTLATSSGARAAGLAEHAVLRSWNVPLPWLTDAAIRAWDGPGWGLPLIELPGAA
jgi:o-succinylbenzoate synthase